MPPKKYKAPPKPPKGFTKAPAPKNSLMKFLVPTTVEERVNKYKAQQEQAQRALDEKRAQFYSAQIQFRTNQHFAVEKIMEHMNEIRKDFASHNKVISDQDLFGEIVRNLQFVENLGPVANLLNFPEYVKPDLLPVPSDIMASYEVTLTNEELKQKKIEELLRKNDEILDIIDTRHGAPRSNEPVDIPLVFDPRILFDFHNPMMPSEDIILLDVDAMETDLIDQTLNF